MQTAQGQTGLSGQTVGNQEIIHKIKLYSVLFEAIRKEMSQIVVGQKDVVNTMILALICNGHCLVEGVPGIGKTLTIRALSKIMGCDFSRIQFTPDLLPSDIIGITAYDEKKGFYTVKGPIFANFILADEINRAPPKVQSALLEGMQERQVTIGKETFAIQRPFFVMSTQNPLENLGTYTLPEAQVDRFLFKIKMGYPNIDEEADILRKNMTIYHFDEFKIRPLLDAQKIINLQEFVKKVYLDKKVEDYIVRIVDCTRNPKKYGVKLGQYIQYGASPRGTIALYISSKAMALLNGRPYVTPHDVKEVAHITLRHRLILNYEGQAEEIDVDNIIDEILSSVPIH
ncbi:MoxR family ATPase [Candidatus Woesearchaeota archaeon]|nr:MoxR family ATPase [Candidatus Woesearchaeota archaeon]